MELNQSFLWQKIMIYELRECRVDRLHEAKDKNHYAAVLNQALNDNQVIVFFWFVSVNKYIWLLIHNSRNSYSFKNI